MSRSSSLIFHIELRLKIAKVTFLTPLYHLSVKSIEGSGQNHLAIVESKYQRAKTFLNLKSSSSRLGKILSQSYAKNDRKMKKKSHFF